VTECPDLVVLETDTLPPDVAAHIDACDSCRLVMDLREPTDDGDDCARFEAVLAARADGTNSRAAAALLARHLESCEACRAISETLSPSGDAESDHASLPSVDPSCYALGLEVARGGMGRILAARDLRIGRQVVVKELLGRSRQLAARFEREARVTARLQHPGIVPIYEIGRWPDGTPFYSMRMVEGRTLREAISAAPTVAARLALLPAVLSAAEAVAFAHSQRVIHRDLTPSNVLVGEYGETVVIDWGLAKDLADATDKDTYAGPLRKKGTDDLTNMGAVIGTLAYMPPEQANGEAVDERADVYAIGAILYHVLAGAAPYRDTKSDELLRSVKAGPPTPIDRIAPGAPKDLLSIVAKAMARDPAARYPSARELTEELERFRDGQMVIAHAYSTAERMLRFTRRHRGAVTVTALAFAALAVVGAVAVRRVVREGTAARETANRLQEEKGRIELLSGNSARAIAYLEAAYRRNKESPTLKLMLGLGLQDLASIEKDLDCEGAVRAIHFSPDGNDLLAVCRNLAKVWRVDTLELRYELGPFEGGFNDAEYSHDGATIATWGDDGYARLWNAATGTLLHTLQHGDPAHSVDGASIATTVTWARFTPDDGRLSTTAYDGWARIWDTKTGHLITEIQGSSDPLFRQLYGVLSKDGTRLLTVTHAGIGNGWEIATGKKLEGFRHGARVLGGRQSPDRTRAVTCGMDGLVKVWDLVSGKMIVQLSGGTSVMWFCEFSHDSARVLGTGHDGSVFVWDIATGAVVSSVKHGSMMINAGHFSYDGERFVTIGVGGSVKVWDTRTSGLLASHETLGGREARITPDGRRLIAARGDGHLRVWRSPSGPLAATLDVTEANLVGVSRDGSRVVTASPSREWGEIEIRDLTNGRRIGGAQLHAPAASSATTDRLVAMSGASTVAVVDVETASIIKSFELASSPLELHISDDGRRMLATFADRGAEVWNVDTGQRIATLAAAREAILSPDGQRALLWTTGQPPRVWDVTGATRGASLPIGSFEPLGFTRDASRIATITKRSESSYTLVVWDASTGFPVGSLGDLSSKPTFDRTNQHITAVHAERSVDIWDLEADSHVTFTGEALQRAVIDPTANFVVGISAQGNVAVVLDTQGRALARWPIAHDKPTVSQDSNYQYMVKPPQSAAWWTSDGQAVLTLSTRLALWKTSHDVSRHEALAKKYVPWRLENGRLVPVLARVHGTVRRGDERVPNASVELVIRKPPDVVESAAISYRGTDTKITSAKLSSDEEGQFQGSGLAPGDYTLTVRDGMAIHQTNVTVSVEDEAVDIDLDELPAR
jgi:WD40 repeat protein